MRLLLGDDGIYFAAGQPALANQDLAQTTRILCLMLQPTGELIGSKVTESYRSGDVAREVLDLNSLESRCPLRLGNLRTSWV